MPKQNLQNGKSASNPVTPIASDTPPAGVVPSQPPTPQSIDAKKTFQELTLKVQDSVIIDQPPPGKGESFRRWFGGVVSIFIVPLALWGIAHYVQDQSETATQETARNNREVDILNSYIDSATVLLVNRDIDTTEKTKIEKIIRSKSLLISRQVDGSRKGQVVRFLYDQELIFSDQEIARRVEEYERANPSSDSPTLSFKDTFYRVELGDLNLVNADFSSAFIPGINLSGTTIRNGMFNGADLSRADFREADLSGADLSGTNLSGADLSGADLSGADLSDAKLLGTLWNVPLSDATKGVTLSGAMVGGAMANPVTLQDATFTDDTTPKAICEQYSILKKGTSTCPTNFPEGFEPLDHGMTPLS